MAVTRLVQRQLVALACMPRICALQAVCIEIGSTRALSKLRGKIKVSRLVPWSIRLRDVVTDDACSQRS